MTNESDNKPRVLFVDDEAMVLKGFKLHLRKEFDVHTCESGAAGLEALRVDGPFDVVVSDMRMPQMNGAEFLSRAREGWPDTVRILLTGYADTSSAIRAVNEGQIFRFLTKPCRPPELAAAIRDGVSEQKRLTTDRSLLRQEAARVSERIIEVEHRSKLGSLAGQAGHELANLAAIHQSMLDATISRAEHGDFVSKEDLSELRWIEESLKRHADELQAFAEDEEESSEDTMIDLREIAARTLQTLQVLGALKHIEVSVDFPDELPHVRAVPRRLRHAVLNLLLNAIDAVEDASPAHPTIDVRCSFDVENHRVVLSVSDNGTGIHPETRPFIFKPYFSTKKDRPGLGLAVTSQIVTALDGELSVDSEFGERSTFRVSLPVYSPSQRTVEGRLRREQESGILEDHALAPDD